MRNIVLVTEVLTTGGAETFVMRLCVALKLRGLSPVLFVLRGDLISKDLIDSLKGEISVIAVNVKLFGFFNKLDGILYKLRINFSFLRNFQAMQLRKCLLSRKAELAHSHLINADLVTAKACESLGIPWVSTMHGDYLALEKTGCSRAARIPDFELAIAKIKKSVGHVVCISDQQIEQVSRLMPFLVSSDRISKIYNGYDFLEDEKAYKDIPALLLNIPEDAFVVGMVARGIREKGWDVIISAFEALALDDAWLVLVGGGEYLQQICDTSKNPRIIFCGNVVDPLRYISRFDIACLPTLFSSESLPTVIIEYMLLGKPVVATSVGEIPNMLNIGTSSPAGLLVDLGQISSMARQMQTALLQLYGSSIYRKRLGENAKVAAKKFDMDDCLDAYLEVFSKTNISEGGGR